MAYVYPVAGVGAIFLVQFRMTWVSSKLINTFHYRLETNVGGQTIKQIADDMDLVFSTAGQLYPTHNAARSSTCVMDTVNIQQIEPLRYVPVVYVKGTGGARVPPLNVPTTAHISANIERRGVEATRHSTGGIRMPVPGDDTTYQLGAFTVAYKALLTAIAGAIQTPLVLPSGSTLKPVIYNRGIIPNYTYVGSAFFQDTVRSQDTRILGRGI